MLKNNIKSMEIASKINGVSIKIHSDLILTPSQVTGWFNESTSWYYMLKLTNIYGRYHKSLNVIEGIAQPWN